jgi:predicted dehydrogenase
MINVAVIGVTGFGHVHYLDIMREVDNGNFCVKGAVIINPDEAGEQIKKLQVKGALIFEDYQKMLDTLAGQIDICFIPTSIHWHAKMAIAAMQSGANVYLEKPAAATVQEIRAMQQVEKETGKWVAIGFQSMYTADMMAMKKAILNGDLGEVTSIKFTARWPRRDSYYSRNNWAGKLKSANGNWILDSPFNNAVAHQVNAIAFLAGNELWKTAKLTNIIAEMYRARDIESADTACARILSEDGKKLYFSLTHACEDNYHPHLEVIGSKGIIKWDIFGEMYIKSAVLDIKMPAQDGENCRVSVTNALINKINGENQFICGLDIAIAHTIIVNGIHESAKIVNIPKESISELYDENNDRLCVIKNIAKIMDGTFDDMKLFSEVGVIWANPGKIVDLSEYESSNAEFPRGELL